MELTEMLSALGGTQSMARKLGISEGGILAKQGDLLGGMAGDSQTAGTGGWRRSSISIVTAIRSTTSSAWLAATCAERLRRC